MNETPSNIIRGAIEKLNKGIQPSIEYVNKEKWQSYFTPSDLARDMQKHAGITDTDIVLDPSAGVGNLVDGLDIPKENIYLIEPNGKFCEMLRKKGYINIIESTFEEATERDLLPKNINKIIMNPPFFKQTDLRHIVMSYDLINPDGIVVSVFGKNSVKERNLDNTMSQTLIDFNDLSERAQSYQIISLEEGTFKTSGTVCDTFVAVFEKGQKKIKHYRK